MSDEYLTKQELHELNAAEARSAKAPWSGSFHVVPGNRCVLANFGATIVQGTGDEGSFSDNATFVIKVRNAWAKIAKTIAGLMAENQHMKEAYVPRKELVEQEYQYQLLKEATVPKEQLADAKAEIEDLRQNWAPKGTAGEKAYLIDQLKKYGGHRDKCWAGFWKRFRCKCGFETLIEQVASETDSRH